MRKQKMAVHTLGQHNQKKGFNDNDARYMCCMNKWHLRKGAAIVGGVELGAVGITIVYCVIAYFLDGFYKASTKGADGGPRRRSLLILALVMSIIAFVIWSIAIGLMLWGVKKLRPSLLIPHMMIQALAILSLGGLAALFIWWAVAVHENNEASAGGKSRYAFGGWDQDFRADRNNVVVVTALFAVLAAASIFAFFIEIWFFFVIRRCYKYLRAKINYQHQQQQQQRKLSQSGLKF